MRPHSDTWRISTIMPALLTVTFLFIKKVLAQRPEYLADLFSF